MRKPITILLVVSLAACHDPVFAPPRAISRGPADSGSFHRITFNPGADLFPSWVPDGSGIIYSYDSYEAPPFRPRCLGLIGPEGGTRTALACKVRAASDSIDESDWPTPGPGGAIVYSWSPFGFNPYIPDSSVILTGTLGTVSASRPVFKFPYIPPGSQVRKYTAAESYGWLDGSTLVASAFVTTIVTSCFSCAVKTETCGRDIILLDLKTRPASLSTVPNTSTSTSVVVGGPGVLYYTLMGDSRIHRRVLATGADSVIHDYGAAGIVRDLSVAGGRLAAVVGGTIVVASEPINGTYQEDHGGLVHLLTLTTGADTVLPDSGLLFRHPALSPTGDRLVAEAWQGNAADLWFFRLP